MSEQARCNYPECNCPVNSENEHKCMRDTLNPQLNNQVQFTGDMTPTDLDHAK